MNALTRNRVMCAEPGDCCQPATTPLVVGLSPKTGEPILLEFCDHHAGIRLMREAMAHT